MKNDTSLLNRISLNRSGPLAGPHMADEQLQQLIRLGRTARRDPQAVLSVVEYWLGSVTAENTDHVDA